MEKDNGSLNENELETKEVKFVPPDGGYGWIVVIAIILINATLLPLVQCFGILFKAEFSAMGITAAENSFLLHLQSSMYCVIGFFSSPLLKMYNFSYVASLGAVLWCIGILLSSFVNSYAALIFTVSILTGVGQGIVMPATYLAIYSYFKKRLTLAVSISTTGASILAIFMPQICNFLLPHQGRKNTNLILFAISLLSLVGCFLMKPPPSQKHRDHNVNDQNSSMKITISGISDKKEQADTQLLPTTVYKETTIPAETKNNMMEVIYNMFDLKLLKQLPYVLIVVGLGISFAAELNVILTMHFILPELSNFTPTDVANVASIQNIFDISGRLIIPFLTYRFDMAPRLVYASALVLATFARIMLASFSKSYGVVYFTCSLIGLTKGTRAVFQSVIIPGIVPLEKIPAANGINMLFNGGVSLVVGPIIGAIHDATDSYVPALHIASALSCSCIILWTLEFMYSKRRNPEG